MTREEQKAPPELINRIEDLVADLSTIDLAVRKSMLFPSDTSNVPQLVATLAGLAAMAARTAQSISFVMANQREAELLEARLRDRTEAN